MSAPFDRSKALFLAAVDLHGAARDAFLTEACGGDADLQREVASLLAFHDDEAAALEPEPQSFHAGALFANRYRMIARLGRGGMGDVWRADDLVLETAVALKLIHATGLDARRRVLNEVRLARQITHAAVCRVFDVGESDGHIFFSMELVEGEDLATVLRRAGRLSSDKVVDIGIQLCAGLGAAHAQGVLHRDLKPANVLVDDRGNVRITDFGIAVMRTPSGRHTRMGTPGYMAPEQLTPDGAISEQTDVYALGLILYELVVGSHTFDHFEPTGAPPAPSTLAADLDPLLERVILDALAVEPSARPSSAAAMEDRLQAVRASQTAVPRRAPTLATSARWWLAGAAGAVILALLAFAGFALLQRRATTLTARDTIVLTDFANSTGDPVFDGALKVALAVALEQSPFLRVFPDERVRDTLRLMKRPVDAGITRTVAREVAQRERLTALIAGSIDSLGRHYLISLEAIDADSGEVMAREQAEVEEKEQVLSALGRASSTLRQKLGESVSSTQKFDVALPKATTSSLEALQAYSLALEGGRWMTVKREGIPHLMRAIELDPEFALAQAALSGVYANTGQSGLAPEFARRAFELRDRVSERERFFISWRYYRDATQAQDKALELARTWMVTYPREMFAFNSFGLASSTLGRHEQAIEPFRRAIALDPTYFAPYDNLAAMMLTLGRFDDAQAVLQEAADH
ncbi:MAG: serine/threonine-protein kinase, partial [Vicinamibacterales bacterium]